MLTRTLPIASSIPPRSFSKDRPSFPSNTMRNSSIRCCYNHHPSSRRLALFQLGTAISQSQLFGAKLLKPEGNSIEGNSTFGNVANAIEEQDALDWVKNDKRRMLHVVYRVDYGVDKYDIGDGFGHFGIAAEDVAKTINLIKAKGGKVTREPGPVKGGNTIIAFIEDPDGYKFEILERRLTSEPLCQVMLRVGDLDRSINFYKKAFGMDLLRKKDNPDYKYATAIMGYGPEDENAVLELTYNYGVTDYDKGNGYAQVAIGTNDVYKTAEAIKLYGGEIVREPGPLPGINTKITVCLDPDGWKWVFVDNVDFLKELE
ncbi:hypothetical protein CCACVL1_23156 [Corchorus capsularis]|uniref:lactoylglutathione lyase n=1 Tax=Corchorus capsularis TaxID=210143 RepID=A0A1R3GV37_COCAP|nr:hypothetical protein CCACVL1_23156 [Corchorus capsularis]